MVLVVELDLDEVDVDEVDVDKADVDIPVPVP